MSLFYNPDLRLKRLEAGVALAAFEFAGLWEDPVFGFDAADVVSNASPLEYGLTIGLTIPVSGRLGVEKDRAGAAHEAAMREVADAEWRTRHDVRRAWATHAAATENERLLAEAFDRVGALVEITDRLETGGVLRRVEGRLFRVELSERGAALRDARLKVRNTRRKLLGLMGLAPDATIELPSAITAREPVAFEDPEARLIERNTRLAIERARYRVAEESLRLEVREQYPDISIGGGYGSEDDDRLLLGVSIPIPLWNANRAGIAQARAERELARARAEVVFEGLLRELDRALATYTSVRTQSDVYEREALPLLDEQSREVDRLVELGEVDTVLLLETLTRELDAKSRLLELRLAESLAGTEIDALMGPEAETTQSADERMGAGS